MVLLLCLNEQYDTIVSVIIEWHKYWSVLKTDFDHGTVAWFVYTSNWYTTDKQLEIYRLCIVVG